MTTAFVLSGGGSLAAVQVGMLQALAEHGIRPATDVLTGQGVLLSGGGDAVSALLASCAIPGVYPSVQRDGRVLCDGALADCSAVSRAAELGADRVYVLSAGTQCALERAPRHPVTAAVHALTLLLHQRAVLETRAVAGALDVRVISPLCPLTVSASDFGHARELVGRARRAADEWLDFGSDERPAQDRFLSLHAHRGVATSRDRVEVDPHGQQLGAQ